MYNGVKQEEYTTDIAGGAIGGKGNWELIEEDVSTITETVRKYLPGFPEPAVHEADEYEGEPPIVRTGAWHDEGELYFTDAPQRAGEFPQQRSSPHEMGHAVGWYIKQAVMPSFTDVFTVLNEEELQQLNELPEEDLNKMDAYAEMRSELSSGHFAAAFEHALRHELDMPADNIEGVKKYADAEDGCIDTERDYFWDDQDEQSLHQFLHTAVQEADTRRQEVFDLLPDERVEEIDYKEPSNVFHDQRPYL